MFHLYYNYITIYFILPLEPTPPTPFLPSLSSFTISSIFIYLYSEVVATFSATISGSKKSIKILAGDEAKFAPAVIIASK